MTPQTHRQASSPGPNTGPGSSVARTVASTVTRLRHAVSKASHNEGALGATFPATEPNEGGPTVKHRILVAAAPLILMAGLVAATGGPASASTARVTGSSRADDRAQAHRDRLRALAQATRTTRAVALPSIPAATLGPIVGPAMVYDQWNTGSGVRQMLVRSLATGATAALTNNEPTICPDQPSISPDGTQIAYIDYWGGGGCYVGGGGLYVLDVATGTAGLYANFPAHAWLDDPSWSPDSSTVLFTQVQDDASGNLASSQLETLWVAGHSLTPINTAPGVDPFDGVYLSLIHI